jgi:hypothetical protein
VVVPVVAEDCGHIGFWPLKTVTILVFAEAQVTLEVTSTVVPPAAAWAVKQFGATAVELAVRVMELGFTTTLVTFPRVTVAVVVAVAVPDAADIVLVPAETPVSSPPVVIVAMLGVELDQQTVLPEQLVPPVRVIAFPLLSVPAAVNCVVRPWLTVGLGGSIVMLETVGFTKKPVQLMVSAEAASRVKVQARQSFCLVEDIVVETPLPCAARDKIFFVGSSLPACVAVNLTLDPRLISVAAATQDLATHPLRYDFCADNGVKNCSRTKLGMGLHVPFRASLANAARNVQNGR